MEGLRGGHINSISQGGDDKSRTVAQILVTVEESSISNTQLVIFQSFFPIGLELRLPLEFVSVGDLLVVKFEDDVTRVSIHSDHAHNFLSHGLGQITLHHQNQISQKLDLILVRLLHLFACEGFLNVHNPVDHVDQKGHHCGIFTQPLLLWFLLEAAQRVGSDVSQRLTHGVNHILQVVLDLAP